MSKPYQLKIETIMTKTGPAVRVFARIRQCAKRGIHIRAQKTFRLKTVNPTFTSEQMLPSIEAELDRWAARKLSTINAL